MENTAASLEMEPVADKLPSTSVRPLVSATAFEDSTGDDTRELMMEEVLIWLCEERLLHGLLLHGLLLHGLLLHGLLLHQLLLHGLLLTILLLTILLLTILLTIWLLLTILMLSILILLKIVTMNNIKD